MRKQDKVKVERFDYRFVRNLSHRVDCTITEADFNTRHPNPYRIDCALRDIRRYLKYDGGNTYGFKYQ